MSKEATLEQPPEKTGRRELLSKIVRPVVSLSLLYFLLRGMNWNEFLDLAHRANWIPLAIALALVLAALLLSAYKWQRLLAAQHTKVPLGKLFVLYLIGLFFNNFLPTSIGGDVIRIHELSRYTGKAAASAASVVAERLLAAFALALTAAAGLLLSFQTSQRFSGLVIGVFGVTAILILFFAIEEWRIAAGKRIWLPEKFGLRRRLSVFAEAMSASMQHRINLAWVIFLSIGFHITVVLITYCIFVALGINVPLAYCLLFIPIISAIQMLPVSISGFGVREGAYVYFFGGIGLSGAQAIASSLIFWAIVALVSLGGGVLYAARR